MNIASQVGLTRRQRSQAEGGSRRPRSARASRVSCSAIAHAPRVVGRTIRGAPDAAAPRTASRPRCSLCSPYVRAELCRAPSRRRASRMSSRPSSSWLQWAVHRRRGHVAVDVTSDSTSGSSSDGAYSFTFASAWPSRSTVRVRQRCEVVRPWQFANGYQRSNELGLHAILGHPMGPPPSQRVPRVLQPQLLRCIVLRTGIPCCVRVSCVPKLDEMHETFSKVECCGQGSASVKFIQ